MEFRRQHPQTPVRSLSAFEQSNHAEDWQQLMSRYMVRRTRSFIKDNYAKTDPSSNRKYLEFPNGIRSYFPLRTPKTARFAIGNLNNDQYARLYSEKVVDVINSLALPRYGLGNYEESHHHRQPNSDEQKLLNNLSLAGWRLMGFCRTNLFKRLESSGIAFIQSLERHILRNYVYLYAIEQGLDIPIGTQDAELLDTQNNDEDTDSIQALNLDFEAQNNGNSLEDEVGNLTVLEQKEAVYKQQATKIYELYQSQYKKRFKWLRSNLFRSSLTRDLKHDSQALIGILQSCGEWRQQNDHKLQTLVQLITKDYPDEKILIFTQFADTARYIGKALIHDGLQQVEVVTGSSSNPTETAHRFSPKSNNKNIVPDHQIRVLITTDVLSEGQNLQDSHIIINYDLPWAIIRLIQRAGRIDRIGQESEEILCYSFLPADGVEQLINLRGRLRERLQENASVVGTDEIFFEGGSDQILLDLYHEKAGIIDEDEDSEVDLTSEALQIWKNAIDAEPKLEKIISQMPNVVYATRKHDPENYPTEQNPEGVLMYLRTADGTDALAWLNRDGKSVTQSQARILRMARCNPDTPPQLRHPQHHELVEKGAKNLVEQQKSSGGQLGSPRSARAKIYERLSSYMKKVEEEMLLLATGADWENLRKAHEEIYKYPLRQTASNSLNRQLKSGATDEQLAEMVRSMRDNDQLCIVHPEEEQKDAQIICSMGLFKGE
jgi:superfamily II DNA/RNA helicase